MRPLAFLMTCLLVSAAAADDALQLQARLQAHIQFLASDLLGGRQPGTDGYDIAANYVASQFRQLGLQPAGNEGSYLQPVPLRRAWLAMDSAGLAVVRDGQRHELAFVEQFYRGPDKVHTEGRLQAEMVFAGYGIEAPELDYSDYDGVDVHGKVVVVLAGQPENFPSEEGAHFSSGVEKTRAAVRHGAVGFISVYTPRTEKRFAWERVRDSVGMPAMGWLTGDGEVYGLATQIRGKAIVHYDAGSVLFEGSGHTLSELLALDQAGAALSAFPLAGQVILAQRSRHEAISSPNVAAFLPGSDPLLGGEFVVYTAHLDHIGELHGEGHADAINNGALDNASGVAVMLETARQFVTSSSPRRSVLFLAVTAEEKGLVGSEYFAQNPTIPVESMVGVINLDMPLLLYDFGDVIAFGASHSDMGQAVDQAATEAGIVQSPDPFPQQNVFVRSDHYRFVQRGIPSIFLVTGMTTRDGETDTQPIFMGFLKNHYHKPSDDLNLPINYEAAARFTRINARIGEIIANNTERPSWHEGDFFGSTFGQ